MSHNPNSIFAAKAGEVPEIYFKRFEHQLATCTDAELMTELENPQAESPHLLRATERQALSRLLYRSVHR